MAKNPAGDRVSELAGDDDLLMAYIEPCEAGSICERCAKEPATKSVVFELFGAADEIEESDDRMKVCDPCCKLLEGRSMLVLKEWNREGVPPAELDQAWKNRKGSC